MSDVTNLPASNETPNLDNITEEGIKDGDKETSNYPEPFDRIKEKDLHSEDLTNLVQNRKLRKDYANNLFVFIVCWLGNVLLMMYLSGFGFFNFKLSENILITFISTTTINVLGIYYLVIRYLFQTKNEYSVEVKK